MDTQIIVVYCLCDDMLNLCWLLFLSTKIL